MEAIKGMPVKDVEYCNTCGHQMTPEGACPQCEGAEERGEEGEEKGESETKSYGKQEAGYGKDDDKEDDEEPNVKGIKQNGQGVTRSY